MAWRRPFCGAAIEELGAEAAMERLGEEAAARWRGSGAEAQWSGSARRWGLGLHLGLSGPALGFTAAEGGARRGGKAADAGRREGAVRFRPIRGVCAQGVVGGRRCWWWAAALLCRAPSGLVGLLLWWRRQGSCAAGLRWFRPVLEVAEDPEHDNRRWLLLACWCCWFAASSVDRSVSRRGQAQGKSTSGESSALVAGGDDASGRRDSPWRRRCDGVLAFYPCHFGGNLRSFGIER